jgi:S-adenosylmethionine hydrolase
MFEWVTFLTDYGFSDAFVGTCHGVIARVAPQVRVIDVSHTVPAFDVEQGALLLASALPYLPSAVHLAVVDPGVGTARRPVAVEAADGAILVGPDNGLLSLAWDVAGGATRAVVLDRPGYWLSGRPSPTFHGRDVFAPVAAHLASGVPLAQVGSEVDPDRLRRVAIEPALVAAGEVRSRVLSVDGFGNVALTATAADLVAAGLSVADRVQVGNREGTYVDTFADVPPGELALLVDSAGHVALAVNGGSAASVLALAPRAAIAIVAP